jgi:hypothetical protein
MEVPMNATVETWKLARFPSRGQRQEFLSQVHLWNTVEGLPRIEADPLNDGIRVRFRSADPRQENILRLVDAFGGFVGPAMVPPAR